MRLGLWAAMLLAAGCRPVPGVAVPTGSTGSELYRWELDGKPRVGTGADYCADMELSLRLASGRKSYVGWGFTTLSALAIGTSTVLATDEDPSTTKRHVMAGAPLVGAALAGIAAAYFLRSVDTAEHAAEAARAASDPTTAADKCLGVLADWNESRRHTAPNGSGTGPPTPEPAKRAAGLSAADGECGDGDLIGIYQLADAHAENAALLVDASGQLAPSEYQVKGGEAAALKQAAPEISSAASAHRVARLRLNGHVECLFVKPVPAAKQCRVSLAGLLHAAGAQGSMPGMTVPDAYRLDCSAGAPITVPDITHRSLTEAASVARWNEWTRPPAKP